MDPDSLELKPKEAVVAVVEPLGPEEIVVSGAVVSTGGGVAVTVQLRAAEEASALFAASVARTLNSWPPTASEEYACGEEHEPQLPLSSLQAKLEPDSLELKVKFAVVALVEPLGPPLIVVSGAVVSTGGVTTTGGGVGVEGWVGVVGAVGVLGWVGVVGAVGADGVRRPPR